MSKYSKADMELQKAGFHADDMILEEFDAAELMTSEESVIAYLDAALKTQDLAYFQKALNTAARAEGMAKIAAHAGITREGAYKSLRAGTEPRLRTIMNILDAMGMTFQIVPKDAANDRNAEAVNEATKNDNSYALAG